MPRVALAEAVAGSEAALVERMNRQAERLGMSGTRFANASGRPDPLHYSTAIDLARLAEALLRDFPADYALFAVPQMQFNGLTPGGPATAAATRPRRWMA
jgi:D-alanyl-D-alanine carboxypeptidase (penicillin-binding protein 5/6)